MIAVLGTGCASSLKDGLVAYYPFNGNAKDASGNENHGDVSQNFKGFNNQLADRFGAANSVASFDGLSDVVIGHAPSLSFSSQLTISVWLANPGMNTRGGLICNGPRANNTQGFTWGLCVGPEGDSAHCFLLWDGNGSNKDFFVRVRGWKIPDRKMWNHVSAVYDGTFATVYVNGQMHASVRTKGESIGPSKHPITIGMVDHNSYGGQIDDLRIYNRALSAKEVKALYDLEKPKTK